MSTVKKSADDWNYLDELTRKGPNLEIFERRLLK